MSDVGCQFVELKGRGLSEMSGRDAVSVLHKFCTNDVQNLPVGRGCEAFVLDAKGQIQFYALVHRRPESLLLEFPADVAMNDVARRAAQFIGRYVIVEDVRFTDRSAELVELLIAGPDAVEIISEALEATPPAHVLEAVGCPSAGPGAWLCRSVQSPSPNFTLFATREQCECAKVALISAGAISRDAAWYEAHRIAARMPLLGSDIGDKALPQEIDRNAQTLNFRKGCYLGQETVARLDAMGHVNKTLVLLHAEGCIASPSASLELRCGDQVVGRTTSCARVDSHCVALATVRTSHNSPGTRLTSDVGEFVVAPRSAT